MKHRGQIYFVTVACSVCRYANHLSFPSFCPVLCMLRFPTASEGNASISRGYRTEGDRAAPWSVHSSPQRIKAAQALIVSGFGHWKGSLKTSLRPPGAPARPVQSAPRGGGRSWCWFPGCRLCAHGTRLVRSAQTQRVTVYLQCEFVFRVKCSHAWLLVPPGMYFVCFISPVWAAEPRQHKAQAWPGSSGRYRLWASSEKFKN